MYQIFPMQDKCVLVGYHVAYSPRLSLPHPVPPNAHPSANTSNPASGIIQWAYPSREVCADENRENKQYGEEREEEMSG